MKNILIFVVFWGVYLTGFWSLALEADGKVSTEVSIGQEVSQFWHNTHPSKFMKCWGKPSEVRVFQDEMQDKEWSTNSGLFQSSKYNPGAEHFYPQYIAQTGAWNSSLDKDRTWSLSFSQNINDEEIHYRHHKCSTERFQSKVESVNNSFTSHASFVVPPDVFLIRIERKKQNIQSTTIQQLSSQVKNVRPLIERSSFSTNETEGSTSQKKKYEPIEYVEGVNYYFVHPGTIVDFEVAWTGQSVEDVSFEVEYEIKMSGLDNCDKDLGGLQELGTADFVEFIRKNFSKKTLLENPHKAISALSCLRSKPYVRSLIRGQHGHKLVEGIRTLDSEFLEYDFENFEHSHFYKEVWLSAMMSIYELSRSVLGNLSQLCEPKIVLDGETSGFSDVTYLQHFSQVFSKISLAFETAPVKLLSVFAETLKSMRQKGHTYKDLSTTNNLLVLREIKTAVFDQNLQTSDLISDLYAETLNIDISSHHRDLILKKMQEVSRINDKLDTGFREQLIKFGYQVPELIKLGNFEELLAEYVVQMSELKFTLQEDIDWFATEDGEDVSQSQIYRDLFDLNSDLMSISGSVLDTLYSHYLGSEGSYDFLKKGERDDLYDDIDKCLRGSAE